MKRIQIKDLSEINDRYLLEIHTSSNKVFTCRVSSTSTTTPSDRYDPSGVIGILGYRLQNETEDEIYMKGLQFDRSIPYDQIKEIYIKL